MAFSQYSTPIPFTFFSDLALFVQQGSFLANQYKTICSKAGKPFSESKYTKKISNAQKSSFVIALVCDVRKSKNPEVEEICSVAMAVQNMHLVATAHGVGEFRT